MIRKKNENIECVGTITTNYYSFCSKISNNTVYLNGQLKLFECPELLEVVDVSKDNIDDHVFRFPFLFGQSLVKPIIHLQQIEEFHRFNKILNDTDILVVFGFNINEDDNHINAFLHDFVKHKKILIVTDQKSEQFQAERKLKCSEHIEYCEVEYGNNSNVVEKIFDKIKFLSR